MCGLMVIRTCKESEMDEKRKGEIALMYLKRKLRTEGVRLGQNTAREIGNTAKELGLKPEEAKEFAEIMVREIVEEIFGKPLPSTGITITRL